MVASMRALERLGEVLVDDGPHTASPTSRPVVSLPLEVVVNPPASRMIRPVADDDALELLVASMREHGLLHPIGATARADGMFEVLYGLRRVAAARRLGWPTISASLHLELSDARGLLAGLAENIARRDLNGRERAHVLRLLAGVHIRGTAPGGRGAGTGKMLPPPKQPCSTNGLARRLGVSPRTIYAWVGIGRAPEVLQLVETEALDWTRAGEIVRAPMTVRQQLIDEVLRSGDTSRTRMTTLEIRARGRELAGSVDSRGYARALQSALTSLSAIGELRTDEERQLLEQVGDQVDRLRQGNG